jgi:flotillin
MNLQAMTKEKLQFLLPVVFTIGPDVNQRGANARAFHYEEPAVASKEPGSSTGKGKAVSGQGEHDPMREDRGDALLKYAMLLADSANSNKKNVGNQRQFLENIIKGIIEGETRVLVSGMTMEEIFTEREVFKKRIFRNIQGELDQFGLKIYNANVRRPFLQATPPFSVAHMKFLRRSKSSKMPPSRSTSSP